MNSVNSKKNSGIIRLTLRKKMILGIGLPTIICFALLNFYFLSAMAAAAGSEKALLKSFLTPELILSAVFCIVILGAVILVANSVAKPVKMLVEYSGSLAAGNTGFKVKTVGRGDELGELSRSIREIQTTLVKIIIMFSYSVEDIKKGILSVRIDAEKYKGDYSKLMDGSNKSNDSLCELIGNIRDIAANMTDVSQQISVGAQTVAQGSAEQASTIVEISSTIAGILEMTKENSVVAENTKRLSEEVSANAAGGSQKMKQLLEELEAINKSSSQMSNIIKVIEDIAFQTNILALNASVEAARAGIHGKGFAVVAEEVKNLANKSAAAAKETNEMLSSNISKSKLSLSIGEETEKALADIVDRITRSAGSISRIAEDCARQVEVIAQVNIGLDQISQVVQNNSASAQESAASCEEMASQSETLLARLSSYRIKVDRIVSVPFTFNENDY